MTMPLLVACDTYAVVLFFVLPVSPEKAGPADVTVELEDPTDPIIGLEEE